jgi:hypothetical protein
MFRPLLVKGRGSHNGKHESVLTDLVSHKKINNSFNINPNTIILDSKLKPCVLNFIIFIFCIQIPHI